jgi:hypothetical protein
LTSQLLTEREIYSLKTSKKPFEVYITICKNRNIPFRLSPEQQTEKIQRRWKEIVEESNQNLRICSFSLTNSSLLLWSHYSNEHNGICIEYDFDDIDKIRAFIQPVIYRDKVHKIRLFEEYTTMQLIASSLIKSKEWEYEHEWRLTIFRQKDDFPQTMSVLLPKAIYLGTRFHLNDDKHKQQLFKIAEKNKIPLYQMEKDPNEFKLINTQYTTR